MRNVFNDGSPIWLKFISGLLLTLFALTIINYGCGAVVSAFSSPDENIERERQASCDRIRGKEEEREDLTESAKWHESKFNESIINCFHLNSELLRFGLRDHNQ